MGAIAYSVSCDDGVRWKGRRRRESRGLWQAAEGVERRGEVEERSGPSRIYSSHCPRRACNLRFLAGARLGLEQGCRVFASLGASSMIRKSRAFAATRRWLEAVAHCHGMNGPYLANMDDSRNHKWRISSVAGDNGARRGIPCAQCPVTGAPKVPGIWGM